MRYLSFLLIVAVAFVFAPGCQKRTSEDQARKAEENRADAKIKNFEPLQDPTIRKSLEANPAMAEKYKNELEANKLPGAEPVAPAAPESATSATPADSATPATTETPAAPAPAASN